MSDVVYLMQRALSIILSVLICTSCVKRSSAGESDPVRKAVDFHIVMCQQRYGFELLERGWLRGEKLSDLYLCYRAPYSLDLKQARRLVVFLADDLLMRMNGSQEIAPLLDGSHIGVDHLELRIGFCTDDGEFFDPPAVAYLTLKKGVVRYCYYDKLFGTFIDYQDVEETFEQTKGNIQGADR